VRGGVARRAEKHAARREGERRGGSRLTSGDRSAIFSARITTRPAVLGGIAQSGERINRTDEVGGSNPPASTGGQIQQKQRTGVVGRLRREPGRGTGGSLAGCPGEHHKAELAWELRRRKVGEVVPPRKVAAAGWQPLAGPRADRERGAVAQLGARLNGIEEVRGSNPLSSTLVIQTG
jgi:hypothetical protein